MALLQIAEPGQSQAPHERKLGIGIDLGTSNSLVAAVRNGRAEVLPDEAGRRLLASAVHYGNGGVSAVGQAVIEAAADDPANAILSVKRLMGRGRADLADVPVSLPYELVDDADGGMLRIRTAAGDLSPVQVSAEILRVLAERAGRTFDAEIDGAVITVPAYFDDAQRQATRDAARLAGLNVLRLLNEPTAAAVAYGLDQGSQGRVAVFDLGGGTFDISILELDQGVFRVLATGGDSALGGDDFDQAIAGWALEQWGVEAGDAGGRRRLLTAARRAKEALTADDSATLTVAGHSLTLDREVLEALITPIISRALKSCRRCLRDADLEASDISEVILVGGSTRTLCVRDKVAAFFERDPLCSLDPDEVVALGAAMQADSLVGNPRDDDMVLLDVIPLSLGIETMGGLVERILPRNSTIPVSRAQEFTTYQDGQTAMAIHVVQGERELVDECRSLARFELRGIPPMVAGAARIKVTFQVDADGLLGVSAVEESTGTKSSIVVKPSYGLSDTEIADMLQASWDKAEEDLEQRRLREAAVEARQLLQSLSAALLADGEKLLDESEQQGLIGLMETLQAAIDANELQGIRRATEKLSEASETFAQRRMDASVRSALAGHRVEEFVPETGAAE